MVYHEIWYISIFRKFVEKIQVWLKSDKNKWHFIWRHSFLIIFHSVLLKTRYISDQSCNENQNTFLWSMKLFRKLYLLWNNVEKHSRDGQATDDNMEHANCMMDAQGYKHALRICNILCFSTVTVVARTRNSSQQNSCWETDGFSPSQEIPYTYGNQKLITAFWKACPWTLPRARRIQYIPSQLPLPYKHVKVQLSLYNSWSHMREYRFRFTHS